MKNNLKQAIEALKDLTVLLLHLLNAGFEVGILNLRSSLAALGLKILLMA